MGNISNLRYFEVEQHPSCEDYVVRVNHANWPRGISDNGAYSVLIARLFGVSLAKMCEALIGKYGDKIRITGKGAYYPRITWADTAAAEEFIRICDDKMASMLKRGGFNGS